MEFSERIAPVENLTKVNWDAAVCNKLKKLGIVVVVTDSKGKVLTCLSSSRSFSSQPIEAEFLTLWRAMKLCTELEMENILLEEDALVLVNAIKNEEDCWA